MQSNVLSPMISRIFFIIFTLIIGISHGIDLNGILVTSAREGDINRAIIALNNGSDIESRSRDGGWTALHEACFSGEINLVRVLIERGANLEARNLHFDTPLHIAAFHGRRAIVEILLEIGALVDPTNQDGSTPLIGAAFAGRTEVCNILLRAGAKVDARNNVGTTPLEAAIFSKYKGTADYLREYIAISCAPSSRSSGNLFALTIIVSMCFYATVRQ